MHYLNGDSLTVELLQLVLEDTNQEGVKFEVEVEEDWLGGDCGW